MTAMRYRLFAKGLQALLEDSRVHADIPLQKLAEMQEIFLERNLDLYTPDELGRVRYYSRAMAYKFHLANLGLEQLWSLSSVKRDELFHALANSLDRLEVKDDELLQISLVFEGFLFQARSFLDFYMLYLCLFLRTGHQGSISKKKFLKALGEIHDGPYLTKAEKVTEYFTSRVFGESKWHGLNPNDWGTLLSDLRDKIAHRDRLRPSFDSNESLVGQVLFDWPTLREITYDRFCQYMQNGMFSLFTDVSPVLYDIEWKAGPLKPGLWD